MRKILYVLLLICSATLLFGATQNVMAVDGPADRAFTFRVNAFDLTWYDSMGYNFPNNIPGFTDPADLNAEILLNGVPFAPPIYTPYRFGAAGNKPFVAGTYSVRVLVPNYSGWLPEDVQFNQIISNYAAHFLAYYENSTPVELSSFTATLTGQFYVQLNWTSQSESEMIGYRVYRNTSNDQSTSIMIDHPLIPATNTSSTHNYTVVDEDVLIGQTYYYWLESVDYTTSDFHGPVSVTVTGNVPPVFPEVTSMKNAYPNPFKANGNTNIEVSLKAGETGSLTIYNIMGQVVKTVSLTQGDHTVSWNGNDSSGNACGSGIYCYRLSTPSLNQTKKMVIVK